MNPPEVLPQRRAFFENLCAFLEREGEPLTAAPTVSKQVIDLHRLYIAVRRRGGFEQVRASDCFTLLIRRHQLLELVRVRMISLHDVSL